MPSQPIRTILARAAMLRCPSMIARITLAISIQIAAASATKTNATKSSGRSRNVIGVLRE